MLQSRIRDFVPWVERMKDAGIRWWWIVPIVILESIPEPPAIDGSEFVGHNLTPSSCIFFHIGFVLLFSRVGFTRTIYDKSLQISEVLR